jgi:hypothetical protein
MPTSSQDGSRRRLDARAHRWTLQGNIATAATDAELAIGVIRARLGTDLIVGTQREGFGTLAVVLATVRPDIVS